MSRLCCGSAQLTPHLASITARAPHTQRFLRGVMANRNYFNALAGLKLEDTPTSSPTAAAAASKSGQGPAAALSSSDLAEDQKKGGQQPQQQPPAAASASSDDGAAQEASTSKSSSIKKPRDPTKVRDALVWIDLEMTGLEPEKDTIIEIACLITNGDLTKVLEGPEIAIHHPDSVLEGMNDWCKEHHNKSGLVQRVRDSTISLQEAEQQVLAFVQQHTEYKQAQLAGNSIHVDRVYLQRYMPQLTDHLHYRIVDVSTLKELCRRWRQSLYRQAPKKQANHTAMSDIKESLKELQYYKHVLFRGK